MYQLTVSLCHTSDQCHPASVCVDQMALNAAGVINKCNPREGPRNIDSCDI